MKSPGTFSLSTDTTRTDDPDVIDCRHDYEFSQKAMDRLRESGYSPFFFVNGMERYTISIVMRRKMGCEDDFLSLYDIHPIFLNGLLMDGIASEPGTIDIIKQIVKDMSSLKPETLDLILNRNFYDKRIFDTVKAFNKISISINNIIYDPLSANSGSIRIFTFENKKGWSLDHCLRNKFKNFEILALEIYFFFDGVLMESFFLGDGEVYRLPKLGIENMDYMISKAKYIHDSTFRILKNMADIYKALTPETKLRLELM